MQPTTNEGLLDGRYEIRSVIGGGASAVVYLAKQTAVGRQVAIKVIRPEVFANEHELDRYLREASIVASLNHPHIVTLYDVGRLADERPYMVMEYVRGASLQRLLQNDGHLSVDVGFQVFQQVAEALAHAHRHGVVHRDIKPGNILVEHRSTGLVHARVADFGVASVANSSLTHHGAFIGTPLYMAPEQALGLAVSPRTDIYALGVVMFRALTGVKPFDADTPVALAMRHVTQPAPSMRTVAPAIDVPPELEAVVMRCLAKEPDDRYPSCEVLLQELAEVKVRILPHLLGLSQESLEGPLLIEPPAPAPVRWQLWGVTAAAGLSLAFATGYGLGNLWAAVGPVESPEVIERVVERVIEVPVATELPLGDVGPPPLPVEAPVARVPWTPVDVPEPVEAPVEAPPVEEERSQGTAEARPTPGPRLEPRVGAGGIRSRWEGQVDGKPFVLELQSDPEGHVAAKIRTRSGPTWSSRDMVGRLESQSADRVQLKLTDLEARQEVGLRVTFERDHAWGTYLVGGREREINVTPR